MRPRACCPNSNIADLRHCWSEKKHEFRCICSRGQGIDLSIRIRNINFPWNVWSVNIDLEMIFRFKIMLSGGVNWEVWLCSKCVLVRIQNAKSTSPAALVALMSCADLAKRTGHVISQLKLQRRKLRPRVGEAIMGPASSELKLDSIESTSARHVWRPVNCTL